MSVHCVPPRYKKRARRFQAPQASQEPCGDAAEYLVKTMAATTRAATNVAARRYESQEGGAGGAFGGGGRSELLRAGYTTVRNPRVARSATSLAINAFLCGPN